MPFELDAADDALLQGDLLAGDVGPDRREHAFHAGARVGRAADDLHGIAAGVDHAKPQAVGVGMLPGLDDAGDDEAVELGAGVLDALDLEADAGEGLDDLGERGFGVEVVLQPGEGQFHLCALAGFSRIDLRRRGGGAANKGKSGGRKGGEGAAVRGLSENATGQGVRREILQFGTGRVGGAGWGDCDRNSPRADAAHYGAASTRIASVRNAHCP